MATRTSNKALDMLSKIQTQPQDKFDQFETMIISGGMLAQGDPFSNIVSDNKQIDAARSGDMAVVDKKLKQTGRNALTRSGFWDNLGDFFGFDTKEDWKNAQTRILGEEEYLLIQEGLQRKAANTARSMAATQRSEGIKVLSKGFNEILNSYVPVSEEDKAQSYGLRVAGNEALTGMLSENEEIRKASEEQYKQISESVRGLNTKNEAERVAQENWQTEYDRAVKESDRDYLRQLEADRDTNDAKSDERINKLNSEYRDTHYKDVYTPLANATAKHNALKNTLSVARSSADVRATRTAIVQTLKLFDESQVLLAEIDAIDKAGGNKEEYEAVLKKAYGIPANETLDSMERIADSKFRSELETYNNTTTVLKNNAIRNGANPELIDGNELVAEYSQNWKTQPTKVNETAAAAKVSGHTELERKQIGAQAAGETQAERQKRLETKKDDDGILNNILNILPFK